MPCPAIFNSFKFKMFKETTIHERYKINSEQSPGLTETLDKNYSYSSSCTCLCHISNAEYEQLSLLTQTPDFQMLFVLLGAVASFCLLN